jgi:hypothetical protein
MNKNIVYSLIVLIVVLVASCSKEATQVVEIPYDHEAQIPIDRDLLYVYLDTHYYNTNDGLIWTIGNEEDGSLPLLDQKALNKDENLDSIQGIEFNSTIATYKMYYYTESEGSGSGKEGYSSPSRLDSVFVKYSGMLLDSTVFDSREDYPIWFQLSSTRIGFATGLTKFKRGSFTSVDDDFEFNNQGRGYIFFPSGLGYQNLGSSIIPANSPLIFRIELDDVKLIDTDLDLVPTKFELNIDEAGNITTYDTDGDARSDFEDVDDDNDFTLTKDEVIGEYGSPYDCSDNPSDPNYCIDGRVEVEFEFGVDGQKIVSKGTTNEIPTYKNKDKHLED